jgi:8-oxo-dGTP diphosphatase
MPAVKAIIERDGKILALETEAGGEIYWVLPGGRVEYGEAPVEALEREIQEEISCEAEIGEPVGMYHFFIGPDEDGPQVVLTAFETDIGEQEVDISDNPADENIQDYHWLEPEEFMEKTGNDSLEELLGKLREKI